MPDNSYLSIDLTNFNSRDIIKFIPSFKYDDVEQLLPEIRFEMPAFPTKLDGKVFSKKLNSAKQIDSVLDSNTTYKLTGFNHRIINGKSQFMLYVDGRYYLPFKSNDQPITTWDKNNITNEAKAPNLLKDSIIQVVASAYTPFAPINNNLYTLTGKSVNSPNELSTASGSSSIRLIFLASENIIQVPPSSPTTKIEPLTNVGIRDYKYYDKYDTWTLSITPFDIKTLTNNNYRKDIIIFSYRTNPNSQTKYLIQESNRTTETQIEVTNNVPTYNQVKNYYLSQNNPKISIDTKIYDKINSTGTLEFYARIIRYEDPNGSGNFQNGVFIENHGWIRAGIKVGT